MSPGLLGRGRAAAPRASEASLLLTAMCSARLLSLDSSAVKVLFADGLSLLGFVVVCI